SSSIGARTIATISACANASPCPTRPAAHEDHVMEIAEERIGDVLVLRPAGRLDGNSAAHFERALLAQIDSRPARLVLDLAELEYVSSAGLRAILLAVK